jgi:hypothetical protein
LSYVVGVSIAWIFRARERAQMSATPPEANTEYSRAPEPPRDDSMRAGRGSAGSTAVPAGLLCGGLLGGLLLLVAEFTTLFDERTQVGGVFVKSVSTGSNHSYALVPVALLAAVLAVAVWRAVSRPALLALGVLGVLALLIALLGDLPDAHGSGLIRSSTSAFVQANTRPSAGFYMETLGAVLLIITCVSGFLMLPAPAQLSRRRRSAAAARSPADER